MTNYLEGLELKTPTISSRSVIRYPGGKFRARKILDELLPSNVRHVFSPFIGGGSFELYLTEKNIKVEAIDKFLILANFWEQLSENPQLVADGAQKYLGNVDKELFKELQEELKNIENSLVIENKIDTAVKFLVVNRCSFSGSTLSGGFSKESAKTRLTQTIVDKVRQWYNPHLKVSYGDCHNALKNIPTNTDFLFLDPPYLLEEEKNSLYGVLGNLHKGFDHVLLRDQVVEAGLPFLLTYNNDETVKELWKDYTIKEAEWAYGMNKSKKSSEIIITNF